MAVEIPEELMIYLGLDNQAKDWRIVEYCAEREIEKVIILSPAKFAPSCSFDNHEIIEWAEIIQYKFFYRLLQEINNRTLVVVNECLRTQNRYDLTYNCIRHCLNQTTHQLIFQCLPLIDSIEDFMVLFDFDTRSRWKREKFSRDLLGESRIEVAPVEAIFNAVAVETDAKTKAAYQAEKEELVANIGLKDPHTIPRNLYLMSGKAKLKHVEAGVDGLFADRRYYVGRNNRFKIETLQTYKEPSYPNAPYTVFEFCHNFIDFADFMALSRQGIFDVLVADLKVDQWYLARYREWAGRLKDAQTSLQQYKECA